MVRQDKDPSEFIGDSLFIFRQKEPGENNIKWINRNKYMYVIAQLWSLV